MSNSAKEEFITAAANGTMNICIGLRNGLFKDGTMYVNAEGSAG